MKAVIIRNPDGVRPWQYILESLSGYLWLGARLYGQGYRFSGAWNFGPAEEDILTVREIVQLAIKLWGGEASEGAMYKFSVEQIRKSVDATREKDVLWAAGKT